LVASAEASADPLLPADDWLQRSRLLVGADGLAKLASLNVLLVGLGGVGSFAGEQGGPGRLSILLHRLNRLSRESWCIGWCGVVVQHAFTHQQSLDIPGL
jgi:hypothetical protein